jgi:putative spermidine/putrescine transport system permease protein
VAPLLLFLLAAFVAPIGVFLARAVVEDEVAPILPRTLAALRGWDGAGAPGDGAFAALAEDLREARRRDQERGGGALARAAARLNEDGPGFRSLLPATARRIAAEPGEADPRATVLAASPEWGEAETWAAIRRAAGPVSDFHLLAALDLKRDATGAMRAAAGEQAGVFRGVLARTLWVAALVTALCLLLGYPLAAMIAAAPPRWRGVLLALVLLPFWTSLVVRTAAWMVLLQREGVINAALQGMGLVAAPLPLLFNRFAVVLAMVHILLPFMVLPLYAALRGIDPGLPRAAASLGAAPWRAFLCVTLPLSLPGIGAGCLLVFIQALGFYVTPALLGGPEDQMLAWFIGFFANRTVAWGMAAALSVVLLGAVTLLVGLYARLVGFERVRLAA